MLYICIFGHSDNGKILVRYILSSSTVPGLQLPNPMEQERCLLYVNELTFGLYSRMGPGC